MPALPSLRATTREREAGPLLSNTGASRPLAFVRSGDGIVGFGELLRLTFRGPDRMREAARVWHAITERASIDDAVTLPGSGLIGFGAFAFDDDSAAESVLVIPSTVIGRRGDRGWVTSISIEEPAGHLTPSLPHATAIEETRVELRGGEIDGARYREMVATAVARIRRGELDKVVLARDLRGTLPAGADQRSVLRGFMTRYPDAITYAVDGVIGASPEMLIAAHDGRFFTRVLAGTAARGATMTLDGEIAEAMAESPKNLIEHRIAAASALDVLERLSPDATSSSPFPLRLPNLWHLATDITGSLDGSTLDAIAELHPTAAVAGTPRHSALAAIRELEGVDRGRYAGPVGWVDASGGGEWAIALRGASIDASGTVRAFAGAGIVGDSDPEEEFAETEIKFRPIVEALRDPLP